MSNWVQARVKDIVWWNDSLFSLIVNADVSTIDGTLYPRWAQSCSSRSTKLREDVTKLVTHAQLDTADRALTYITDTINDVFFIITATASILVLVGWNSLRDITNKVEDIISSRVNVITNEYETRLNTFEEKLH